MKQLGLLPCVTDVIDKQTHVGKNEVRRKTAVAMIGVDGFASQTCLLVGETPLDFLLRSRRKIPRAPKNAAS